MPPPLSNENDIDAAVNAIPVIVGVDADHEPPGPLIVNTTLLEMGLPPDPMTLTVLDTDLDDQVHVYFYVDYGNPDPTPPRNECHGSPGTLERTLSCDLDRLCDSTPSRSGLLVEAMVVDRIPNLTGEPLFRAVPEGTGKSFRSWLLSCEE